MSGNCELGSGLRRREKNATDGGVRVSRNRLRGGRARERNLAKEHLTRLING
jgi:hypothetical protein